MPPLPTTDSAQLTLLDADDSESADAPDSVESESSTEEAATDGGPQSTSTDGNPAQSFGSLTPDTGGDGVDTFNPLSEYAQKEEVLDKIVDEFESQPVYDLERPTFKGCGVYAIFYHGDHDLYDEISNPPRQQNQPIYVGKAPPKGSRKGTMDVEYDVHKLAQRIGEHHESIRESVNLRVSDFTYTYLVLEEPWIRFTEKLLTDKYRPWWNCYMDGFGNHDVGSGRAGSKQSIWDTFHPGRAQVKKRALVPRGDPREVWREEVAPKMQDDGAYESVEFSELDVSPYDPRDETERAEDGQGEVMSIDNFYD